MSRLSDKMLTAWNNTQVYTYCVLQYWEKTYPGPVYQFTHSIQLVISSVV